MRSDRIFERHRPDTRSPFQRDRDRILFTSAFRRLAGVTQVVSSDEGQIFHNRLTHSLEVAQIGRRLCERLIAVQSETARKLEIDADVVEAACLAHDLGHPPFGHIAEHMLDKLAVAKGLPDGFEGNAQSFRIVTKLAFQWEKVWGLNLTRATLNALQKYPWQRGQAGKKHRKWGAYSSEESELDFARELHAKGDDRQCPEAAIMDWADDITYSVHDLDDFYRARLIPLHLLARDERERARFYEGAAKRLKEVEGLSDPDIGSLRGAFDPMLDTLGLDGEYRGTQQQRKDLIDITTGLIQRYMLETRLNESTDHNALVIDKGYKLEVKMLKELTWYYVINNPALATQQYGQRKMIEDLFSIYTKVVGRRRDWYLLPVATREQLEKLDVENEGETTRVVVDLIASMTEAHLVDMHRRLTGASLGSALDYLDR
ncbi:MAG: dNTP triphosphohydrolase [Candidatus Sulfotelmatobacter sp.]